MELACNDSSHGWISLKSDQIYLYLKSHRTTLSQLQANFNPIHILVIGLGTSLQWRLMRGNIVKTDYCHLHFKSIGIGMELACNEGSSLKSDQIYLYLKSHRTTLSQLQANFNPIHILVIGLGTSLQCRLMRGNVVKTDYCHLHFKRLPTLASLAS